MNVVDKTRCAPYDELNDWQAINWYKVEKAVREGRWGKAKAFQWHLIHSFHAKLLAVKRVVTNKGKAA